MTLHWISFLKLASSWELQSILKIKLKLVDKKKMNCKIYNKSSISDQEKTCLESSCISSTSKYFSMEMRINFEHFRRMLRYATDVDVLGNDARKNNPHFFWTLPFAHFSKKCCFCCKDVTIETVTCRKEVSLCCYFWFWRFQRFFAHWF